MTVQEMRSGISNLCENDAEMMEIHSYLDRDANWPVDDTFRLMVLLDELKKRMKDEVTHFSFKKKDGTIRQAYGTRDGELIGRYPTPSSGKGNTRTRSAGTFPYFDIERRAWRSFKLESFLDIDRGYTI